jgi:hypothetical protein
MNQDENHLNILSIFYYIIGGLTLLGSLFGSIYIVLGAVFLAHPPPMNNPNGPPPEFLGGIFMGVGAIFMLILVTLGVLQIVAASSLRTKRRWIFCLVVAGLNCLHAPLGTALGVFTFVVLLRPTVKDLFLGPQPIPGGPYRSS